LTEQLFNLVYGIEPIFIILAIPF